MELYYHNTRLNWIQKKIRRDLKISPENKRIIFEFDNLLLVEGLKKPTRQGYLSMLYVLGKRSRNGFRSSGREDIEFLVRYVNDNGFSDWTREKYLVLIRKFFSWLEKDVSWIRLRSRSEMINSHIPEEILTKDEERKVIKYRKNPVDQALIALLAEGGFRIGEILPVKRNNIIFDRHGCKIIVSGKTGMRAVPLVRCPCDNKYLAVNLLEEWLEKREFDVPHVFVTPKIHGEDRGSPVMFNHRHVRHVFEDINRAKIIQRHLHPHLFRHTRATQLDQFLSQRELCEFFGWGANSKMPVIYIRMSGKRLNNTLMRAFGIEVTEKKTPCLWCG